MPTSPIFKSQPPKKPSLLSAVSVKAQLPPSTISPANTPNNNIAMNTGGIQAPPPAMPAPQPPPNMVKPTAPPAITGPAQPKQMTADEIARKQLMAEQQQYQNQTANYSLGGSSVAGGVSPEKKMATVYNPDTGARKAVEVGSQDAQKAFGEGFILETKSRTQPIPTPASVPQATQTAPQSQPTPQTQQPAKDQTQSQIDELRGLIIGALTPGGREQQLQQQLGSLVTGTNANAAALEGQGRGLTLNQVTGQQGALFRAAEAAKMPLQAELDRLEGMRQSAIQAGNMQLAFLMEDKQQQLQLQLKEEEKREAEQQQIQALAAQAAKAGATPEQIKGILASTDFGQALTGAGQFLQAPEDPMAQLEYEKAQLENLKLEQELAGGGSLTPLQELEYQSKLLDIQKKEQDLFGSPGLTQEENQKRQADALQAQEIINGVNGLLNDPGLKGAVGPYSSLIDITGKSKDFIAKLETFKTNLVLPNLDKLKGAMSDNDIKFIKDSAGALNRNMTEEAFIQSLNQIKQKQEHVYNKLQLPEELQIAYDDVRIASPNLSPQAIMDALAEELQSGGGGSGSVDFTNDLSTSVKGLTNGKTTLTSIGSGSITGIDGSNYWKQGLDFQLNENGKTKGAMVKSPVSGTIVDVVYGHKNPNNSPLEKGVGKSQNGGFGNQVKIRLDDGRELWVSHLDDVARVAKGDRINSGQVIGTQGNTGMTYGQTGVHLDLTMKKPDGTYYSAREVAALLGDQRLTRTA